MASGLGAERTTPRWAAAEPAGLYRGGFAPPRCRGRTPRPGMAEGFASPPRLSENPV